jgi:pyruvate/2-oxoglutarate dehydrogenase complex dihydrolipoamide acyltransferase (E2) component
MRMANRLARRPVRGFCTEHVGEFSKVSMPSVMDSAEGTVDAWLKKEGDVVLQGDTLCEVTLADLTIGIDAPAEGWLTILVPENESVGTGKLLAMIAATQEEYAIVSADAVESTAVAAAAEVATAAGEADAETTESSAKPAPPPQAAEAVHAYEEFKIDEAAIILRAVKHMLHTGMLDENGDFAKVVSTDHAWTTIARPY